MVNKDWDDVPYGAKDCMRDITEWNLMVDYIKHSGSCDSGAGYILYDDDNNNEQRFKFFYSGNDSILEGHELGSKNLILKANSINACPYITLFGDSDILNVIENTSDFLVKTCSGTELLKVNDTAITYKGAAIGSGDMLKATYDIGGNGIVDNSEKLEGSTKVQVQNHNPKAHTHIEVDITDLDHDAQKIKGVTVNNTDIADGKILKYNGTSGNLEYEVAGGGGCPVEGEVDFTLWTNCAAQTGERFKFYQYSIDIESVRSLWIKANNSALGYKALFNSPTGAGNVGIGYESGLVLATGAYNVAVGNQTLITLVNGCNNVAVGCYAGSNTKTSMCESVLIGSCAGATNTGSGCVLIGNKTGENNATNNRLYINNSNSVFPLIYGEFDNDVVKFGDNFNAWNIQFMQSRMHMKETTTPAAIANYGAIYCKADNKLYFQDGAGAEHEIALV